MAYTRADKAGLVPKDRYGRESNNAPKSNDNYDASLNIPTFDLMRLNMLELSRQLEATLNKKPSFFIFLRERHNEKLRIEREKITIILDLIRGLRLTQQELSEYQADIFLSPTTLEAIISNRLADAKRDMEMKATIHDDELSKIKDSNRARKIQLEAAEIANLRARAEINHMHAQTQAEQAKADLIKYVVENIDLKNMPQILQTFVIQSIINPGGSSSFGDLELQTELREFVKKEADAKARLLNAQASQSQSQADISRATANDTIRKLNPRKRD